MRQDQLDGLITFVCVAEHTSFSAAAVRLGVSPSAVSQTIRALERRLGATLFNRTTRSVGLTEAGQSFLESVGPAVRELVVASEGLDGSDTRPTGLLRLNMSHAAYLTVLQPILPGFLALHPDVRLEVYTDGALVDIVARGFDAGIRFGDLVERDMIGVSVGPPIAAYVIGSPDYLAKRGTPKVPGDLAAHDCICLRHISTGQIERWEFSQDGATQEVAVSGRLIVNSSSALVQSSLDGLGLAYMINGYIEKLLEAGLLIRVLTAFSPRLPGFTLYYPDRRRVPAKLRALIDYMKKTRQSDQPAPVCRSDLK